MYRHPPDMASTRDWLSAFRTLIQKSSSSGLDGYNLHDKTYYQYISQVMLFTIGWYSAWMYSFAFFDLGNSSHSLYCLFLMWGFLKQVHRNFRCKRTWEREREREDYIILFTDIVSRDDSFKPSKSTTFNCKNKMKKKSSIATLQVDVGFYWYSMFCW